MRKLFGIGALALAVAATAACGKKQDDAAGGGQQAAGGETGGDPAGGGVKVDRGVDLAKKVLYIGALNDESGPAATIGKPYALGKRILAAQINAGGSGLLPDGWKVELVEKDHQYNPQLSVQHYNAIKDQVLFIGTSFGTPNTLPLRDMLERDRLVAFPASLSSEMAQHEHTPPLAPSYAVEAERAMDWVVEHAGGAAEVKAAIVYQKDDYGQDGLDGWTRAAERHGVKIVSQQTVAPGQKDYTAVVTGLKDAGANYVLLTTLPSATGPILGTAAQLQYQPVWIGNTPAWIDGFFDPQVIPSAVFAKFYWVTGFTYWGEDVPGMAQLVAAYEKFGKDSHPPDLYIAGSYVQGLVQIEAFRRALEAGDATRAGYLKALHSIESFNAGGLMQPISLKAVPYVVSTRTRVLQPDFAAKTWKEVAPFADPGEAAAGAEAEPAR